MSVKKEPSGRRSIQVETEVPGTPEQVWDAIATGPGVSSWFVPMRVEFGKDGNPTQMIMSFGPGMDCPATYTAWEPPHRFAAESTIMGPNTPAMATEWTVEARDGGKCLVRVVHSLFADNNDWDGQLEGTESGWPNFFRTLRLYMTHFRAQPCSLFQPMASAKGTEKEVWKALISPLGLEGVKVGQRWKSPAGMPTLAGVIEHVNEGSGHHNVLVRTDEPTTGLVLLGVYSCGAILVQVSSYLYGDKAAAVAAREEPIWQKWLSEKFPSA